VQRNPGPPAPQGSWIGWGSLLNGHTLLLPADAAVCCAEVPVVLRRGGDGSCCS